MTNNVEDINQQGEQARYESEDVGNSVSGRTYCADLTHVDERAHHDSFNRLFLCKS